MSQKRNSIPPKSLGKENLSFHLYADLDDQDPVYAVAAAVRQITSSRVRPFLSSRASYDEVARRFGVHYLRMPYFSRDVRHTEQQKVEEIFAKTKDTDQMHFLARHDELRLTSTVAGRLPSADVRDQATYHEHYAAHYRYLTTAMMLSFIQAAVIGRLEGSTLSPDLLSTLKFSALNSKLSEFTGMPIDRKYLQACIDQMCILANEADRSALFSYPVWLPLGQAYFMDGSPLGDPDMEYVTSRSHRHLLPGEYALNSTLRKRLQKREDIDGLTDGTTGCSLGVFAQPDNFMRQRGYFIDHFIEMTSEYGDQLRSKFKMNTTEPRLNICSGASRVADFWATIGWVDSRLENGDFATWVDQVTTRVVDLEDYAKRNWGYHRCMAPAFLPTSVNAGGDITARECHFNPMGIKPFNDAAAEDTMFSSSDVIRMAMVDGFVYSYSLPYFHMVPGADASLDDFFSGSKGAVFPLTNTDGEVDYPGNFYKGIVRNFEGLLTEHPRFVNRASSGKWIKDTQAEAETYVNETVLKAGVFMPMWRISPVVDPNDPYVHGVYEVIDLHQNLVNYGVAGRTSMHPAASAARALIAFALQTVNQWTNANVVKQFGALPWTPTEVEGSHVLWLDPRFSQQIRAITVFLGDALNTHYLTQLSRGDVFPHYVEDETAGVYAKPNILPHMPVRRAAVSDLGMLFFGGASNNAALDGVTVDPVTGGITVGNSATGHASWSAVVDWRTLWEHIMHPMWFPSMLRQFSEVIDNGVFIFNGGGKPALSAPKANDTTPSDVARQHGLSRKPRERKPFDRRGDRNRMPRPTKTATLVADPLTSKAMERTEDEVNEKP